MSRFAAGAKVIKNQNVAISRIKEQNKIRFDEIAKVQIAEGAKDTVNTIKNNDAVARASMDNKALIEAEEITSGSKKKTKMAGKLAGGVAMLGAGYLLKKRSEEANPMLTEIQRLQDAAKADVEKYTSEYDALKNTISADETSSNTETSSASASNTSGMSPSDRLKRVISYGEGTLGDKGYTTRFGGHQFSLGKDHPRISAKTPFGTDSAAAGKYQIMPKTWDTVIQPALNLPDFSIESQDKAGRFLIERRGVNPDQLIKTKAEFKAVMDKLAPEWASLPYSGVSPGGFGQGSSYHGQGGKTLDDLWNVYQQGIK